MRARVAVLEGAFGFGIDRQLLEPLLVEAPRAERAEWLQEPAGLAAKALGFPSAPDRRGTALGSADPSSVVLHDRY